MIIRVFEEDTFYSSITCLEETKATLSFPLGKKDAPGVTIRNKMSRWKLCLLFLKATWVTLTRG